MFIDTLREERVQDPVEKQRCLTVINQELARLDGMVGKLIELSKIESRHAAFERRVVAVADIVSDALAAFEAVRFGSDVTLNVTVEPGLTVSGDRGALAQALGNLLSNAWKYTQAQEKRITIDASSDVDHVVIAVSDNGTGVPRAEQEAIFEKFRRGSAAARSGTQGSGLGLAIVRAIVKAHRGRIDVRSSEGGARFRITLPRLRPEAA
jgi:signal transduction histidine kinase